MKNEFEHILDAAKVDISLTESERVSMRNHLLAHIMEHPARAPFAIRALARTEAFLSIFTAHSLVYRLAGSALALVLVIGVGTSYAAEAALPGEALYAIKIHINESLRGSLATSHEARAQWNVSLVDKRLAEAETLATLGRLSPVAQKTIVTQLDTVTKNFIDNVADIGVAQKGDGDVTIAIAQTEFEAALNAHTQVLASLGESMPDSKQSLAPILIATKTHAQSATIARKLTEEKVIRNDGDSPDASPAATKERAKANIQKVRSAILASRGAEDAIEDANATTTASAHMTSGSTTKASIDADENSEKINGSNYSEAFKELLSTIRTEEEARINADATANIIRLRPASTIVGTTSVSTDAATGMTSE